MQIEETTGEEVLLDPIALECGLPPRPSFSVSTRSERSASGAQHATPRGPPSTHSSGSALRLRAMMTPALGRTCGSAGSRSGREPPPAAAAAAAAAADGGTATPCDSAALQALADACVAGDAAVVRALAAQGVPLDLPLNEQGSTALHLAIAALGGGVAAPAAGGVAARGAAVPRAPPVPLVSPEEQEEAAAAEGPSAAVVATPHAAQAAAPPSVSDVSSSAVVAHVVAATGTAQASVQVTAAQRAPAPKRRPPGGLSCLGACFGGGPSASSPPSPPAGEAPPAHKLLAREAAAAAAAVTVRPPPSRPASQLRTSAAAGRHLACLSALLAGGADPNACDDSSVTPLMAAAMGRGGHGDVAVRFVAALLAAPLVEANARDQAGRTALALAVVHLREGAHQGLMHAKLQVLQALLAAGCDPNAADRQGMTPLMHGAACGAHAAVLETLLERGASARLMDCCRRSALTHAALALGLDRQPAAGALRRGGRDGSSAGGATEEGGEDGSGAAAAAGVGVLAADAASAIRVLCSWGALDLHPATINARYPGEVHGRTQMHVGVRRGDAKALEALLANGGDVHARDAYGNTPLFYWPLLKDRPQLAAAIVHGLLRHGADPDAVNAAGLRPLDAACYLVHKGPVSLLNVHREMVDVHAILVSYNAHNSEAFLKPHKAASRAAARGSMAPLMSAASFGSVRSLRRGSGGGGGGGGGGAQPAAAAALPSIAEQRRR